MHGDVGVWPASGDELDRLLREKFTSEEFRSDPNHVRYLCWRRVKVREVNAHIRRWIYGPTETPFVAGELALVREHVVADGRIVIGANTEVRVRDIQAGAVRGVPTWCMRVVTGDGGLHTINLAQDDDVRERAKRELHAECARAERKHPDVWELYHAFNNQFGDVQHAYAMTIHSAQGSTFKYAFVDVPDCLRRDGDNREEMKKLLYTAVTRPSQVLFPCFFPGASQ
jgi:exodeoxyribonuclease-5